MKTKPAFDADELTLISLAQEYADEGKAISLLESLRWPSGAICPHCHNDGKEKPNSKIQASAKAKVRKGLYFCGACRKQFTVKVGTIFEDSHIPISKWLMAFFILCSSKKSISAHQMHRMLKVTYKTSWFMCHRIRHAMGTPDGAPKLGGTVEADETYIGGKGAYKGKSLRQTPVVALVERGGDVRTAVVVNVTQHNIGKILHEKVDKAAILNTDEHASYKTPGTEFKRHDTVVHSAYEFSRPQSDGSKAGINSAESFFSLLKRGVYGAWHHVSREHLSRYTNEFEFRWNNRKVSDGQRTVNALQATEGKRLTYRQAI